jgi:cell shape-determining protein MreD
MLKNRLLLLNLIFLTLGFILIIIPLAPVSLVPNQYPSPDVLFCFIFAFLLKNPRAAPFFSIIVLSLLADFLWYRPIGLAPIAIFFSSELLRWYRHSRGLIKLFEELLIITLIFIVIIVFQEIIKYLMSIATVSPGVLVKHALFTLLIYPLITLIIRAIGKENST